MLRAFDIPVAMDDLFSWTANLDVMLPCGIQHTISPLVVTSIFCSLWDNSGGGEDSVASDDEKHSGVRAGNAPNSPQQTIVHDDDTLITNDDGGLGMERDENGGESVTSIRPMEVSSNATRESDNGFPLPDFPSGVHTPHLTTHPPPFLFEFSHIPELATPQDSSALSLTNQKCNDTHAVGSSIRPVSSSREQLDRIKREHDLAKAVKSDDAEVPIFSFGMNVSVMAQLLQFKLKNLPFYVILCSECTVGTFTWTAGNICAGNLENFGFKPHPSPESCMTIERVI